MTTTTKKQTAAELYAARLAEIRAELARIEKALAQHQRSAARDARDYGYAGDLGSCLEHLRDAAESLGAAK